MRLAIDIVGFQSTWWAAALGAGTGRWEPGLIVGVLVMVLQLFLANSRAALFATLVVAALLGIAFESLLIASGLVTYAATWPVALAPPAWLIALWMVFATCIEATARMVGGHALIKGALLGAVVAPPTYWAGLRFGALELAEPIWLPLLATAVIWAIATPIMMATFAAVSNSRLSTRSPS